MKVKVAPFGDEVRDIDVAKGTKVGDIITAVGYNIEKRVIRVNDIEVDAGFEVTEEGSLITLTKGMKGGYRR